MANNTTDANEQGMSCILTEDPMEAKICKALAYSLLLVFSLLGNTLIIMVVCRDDKMKTTTNLLIVNMAVSDLLVPIFAMPRANVEIFYGNLRWLIDGAFGEALCKLTAFFQDISTAVSVQSLVVISVERFYAVWFPLKAIRIKPRVKYVISLMVLFITNSRPISVRFQNRDIQWRNLLLCGLVAPCYKNCLLTIDNNNIYNTSGGDNNSVQPDSQQA